MYSNPLQGVIDGAESLQVNLSNICKDYELAIEAKHLALQAYQALKQTYEEQESEFLFELALSDDYRSAKNAESRKMLQDHALIKARNGGPLRQIWGAFTMATHSKDNAELAFDQMDARFKAVRIAAELQSSMLRAAAIG